MPTILNLFNSARLLLSNVIHSDRDWNSSSQPENLRLSMTRTRNQTAEALKETRGNDPQHTATNDLKTGNTKKREWPTQQTDGNLVAQSVSKKQKTQAGHGDIIKKIQDPKTRPVVEIMVRKQIPPNLKSNTPPSDFVDLENKETSVQTYHRRLAASKSPKAEVIVEEIKHKALGQHHKFGSEEPEVHFPSNSQKLSDINRQPAKIEEGHSNQEKKDDEDNSEDKQDEEEDDDDDDAPEAITTQESEETARNKLKNAAMAIEAQRLKARQKRKEKNEKMLLSHKRKQLESETFKEMEHSGKDSEENDSYEKQNVLNLETESAKPSIDQRHSLPDFLPSEYLDDDSDDSPQLPIIIHKAKFNRSKKIKFDDLVEKSSKDFNIGSTIYRALKPNNQDLAPKAVITARKTKERWLQGRTSRKQVSNRQPFSQGFIKR